MSLAEVAATGTPLKARKTGGVVPNKFGMFWTLSGHLGLRVVITANNSLLSARSPVSLSVFPGGFCNLTLCLCFSGGIMYITKFCFVCFLYISAGART